MRQYAFVSGDGVTNFQPIVFIYDNGKYEVICESFQKQSDYYKYLKSAPDKSFDEFISSFSYFNVESGEVTDEIESMFNKLRAKFMVLQVADQQNQRESETEKRTNPADAVLLRLSQRMRTGTNEN